MSESTIITGRARGPAVAKLRRLSKQAAGLWLALKPYEALKKRFDGLKGEIRETFLALGLDSFETEAKAGDNIVACKVSRRQGGAPRARTQIESAAVELLSPYVPLEVLTDFLRRVEEILPARPETAQVVFR